MSAVLNIAPPQLYDFKEEFVFFIDKNNISQYSALLPIIKAKLGSQYQNWLNNHNAPFQSFEDFISAARIYAKNKRQ